MPAFASADAPKSTPMTLRARKSATMHTAVMPKAARSAGRGLSIAKLLTEKMGGCITASCRGGVLCICIRFPEQTSPIPT